MESPNEHYESVCGRTKKMNKRKKGLGRTYPQLVRMPVVMGMDPREMIALSGCRLVYLPLGNGKLAKVLLPFLPYTFAVTGTSYHCHSREIGVGDHITTEVETHPNLMSCLGKVRRLSQTSQTSCDIC